MARKILVGMLLLGALIVFALSTFYIEDWQYTVFAKGYKLHAQFERVLSLGVGDEVRIAGVEVGRVHKISVDTETSSPKPVRVVMWILEDVKIRSEDVVRIELRSVFGGSFISIQRGNSSALVLGNGEEMTNTVVSAGITDVVNRAEVVLTEAAQTLGQATEGMTNIAQITDRLERGEGTIGRLLTDDTAYNDLRDALFTAQTAFDGIEEFATQVREGEGLLGRLLNDKKLADDAEKLFEEATTVAENLRQVSDDLSAGRGVAGRLLNDESMATDLAQVVSDLKAFSSELAALSVDFDRSSLGRLAKDDEVYRKLNETLDEMKSTVAAISDGDGTVGKLVKDDKLYQQLSTAMEGVQGMLDEYREQSPILTFAGALFGAF